MAPAALLDEQLGRIMARLPIGVIVVTKSRLEILYANAAAQRLMHPLPLRRGLVLPDPWPAFSLREYAKRLFIPGIGPSEHVAPDHMRTFIVSGVTAHEGDSATILIEDASADQRRRRAESEFVANAAHELLTPLTGIAAAAHVLEAGAKDVPEDRERFISHICLECERLTDIARSLLVLARAQSGEQPPRLEVVRLCELLEEIVATASSDADVRIGVECRDDVRVLVDRDLFGQAVLNLVVNAVKHGTGRVRIRAEQCERNRVEFDIFDEAVGGPPSPELEDIGRRFYSSGGRDSGGFGLGISIARQSIEAIGGTLTLTLSESGAMNARIDVRSGASAA